MTGILLEYTSKNGVVSAVSFCEGPFPYLLLTVYTRGKNARVFRLWSLPYCRFRGSKRSEDMIQLARRHSTSADYCTEYGLPKPATTTEPTPPISPLFHQAIFSLTSLPVPRNSLAASTWERVGREAAGGEQAWRTSQATNQEPQATSQVQSTRASMSVSASWNPLVRSISLLGARR
jgi:hypothetical protein